MTINLHIERLVIEGLGEGSDQNDRIKTAVEAELARLLREGGLVQSLQISTAVPVVKSPPVEMDEKASPTILGKQISRGIYSGIGK